MNIRRGDLPEPPPKDLAAKGVNPEYHIREMPPGEVDRFCRAWGVDAHDQWVKRNIESCVVPALKAVILRENASPELRAHEYAHTWGAVHKPNGRGWVRDNERLVQALQPPPEPLTGLLSLGQAAPR